MNDLSVVQQRLQALGTQFLERTVRELATLRELIGRVDAADASALEELRHLSHRMHGTGATLGFEAISRYAGEIEHLCETRGVTVSELMENAAKLEGEVGELAKTRGLQAARPAS
jgi:HPt (histidine-containing phosphotransfer) domain-containing protein